MCSANINSREQQQQQQQPWLVVAGCAQEVLLVWQVHWQQQQQQHWDLGWRLLCSKAPSRGLRPAPQAAGSASSSSDARHLAVAIVAIKQLACPLTRNVNEDREAAAESTDKGRRAAANTGMAALIAVSLSDGRLHLLRLSLPEASWQTAAVLQQGNGCDSFSHPVLSMSVLQLPVTLQKDGETAGDQTSSGSSSSKAKDACLLATGGSDGQAYVFDVTAAVDLLQQQQQTREHAATGSSRASSCMLRVAPVLVLPALHQSGVNDLQLVAATAPACSAAEVAREADSCAASRNSGKQPQQQLMQQLLLLVTGGDDQALTVTQLSAALSSSSTDFTEALSAAGSVTCSNAHTSAIRGLFATPLPYNTHSNSSGSSSTTTTTTSTSRNNNASLLVHSVGLDQQIHSWEVQCTAGDDERCMPGSTPARPDARTAGEAHGKLNCAAKTLQLTQVGCCQTEVPEPAAVCGMVMAQPGLRHQAQALIAVCGRGLECLQQEVEL
jgi:hypothetical protein